MHNVGQGADPADAGSDAAVQNAGDQQVIERLGDHHRIAEFCCTAKAKSSRVERFLKEQARQYARESFARIFVISPREDPGKVLGYYTLSATVVGLPESLKLSNSQRRRLPGKMPVPMAHLGYMGRADDCAIQNFGGLMLHDAAKRLQSADAIAVWGIMLDAELGDSKDANFQPPADPLQDKLVQWYTAHGFLPFTTPWQAGHTFPMFAALAWLLPKDQAAAVPPA